MFIEYKIFVTNDQKINQNTKCVVNKLEHVHEIFGEIGYNMM